MNLNAESKAPEARTQSLYRDSAQAVRPQFSTDSQRASAYYQRYVSFTLSHLPETSAKILDVGCGEGWSTLLFRRAGHNCLGLDLHSHHLEAQMVDPELSYQPGDIQNAPFADNTFDVVCMNAVFEHIPNPERALRESMRILKPGGRLVIVGPHLVSIGLYFYWAVRHTLRCFSRGMLWEKRTPEMPRHPGGNTMPEAWAATVRAVWQTFRKLLGESRPRFIMRIPDDRPPFDADNDACYLCNPMDLLNWAKKNGARPIQWWASDRLGARYLWPFIGGTWVILQKR